MNVRHRSFRRGNQVKFSQGGRIQSLLDTIVLIHKLRKLPDTFQAMRADQEWRRYLRIPMLVYVQIQHQLNQRAFNSRSPIRIKNKAAPGELRGSFEVDELELLTEL